jgi:hypothetical protein
MFVARLIGRVLVIVGLMVLVRDLLLWFDLARWVPMNFPEVVRLVGNFSSMRGTIDGPVADVWVCPVLLVLGGALLWLARVWTASRARYRPF